VSKFEDKDKEQSIQNSKMKTEGGSDNNVKNKDVEDGDLKKANKLQMYKIYQIKLHDNGYSVDSNIIEQANIVKTIIQTSK